METKGGEGLIISKNSIIQESNPRIEGKNVERHLEKDVLTIGDLHGEECRSVIKSFSRWRKCSMIHDEIFILPGHLPNIVSSSRAFRRIKYIFSPLIFPFFSSILSINVRGIEQGNSVRHATARFERLSTSSVSVCIDCSLVDRCFSNSLRQDEFKFRTVCYNDRLINCPVRFISSRARYQLGQNHLLAVGETADTLPGNCMYSEL